MWFDDVARQREIIGFSNAPDARADLWVDADTFLLLRLRVTEPGMAVTTTDFVWLPRTTDNVGRCELIVPAGFTRVALRGDAHAARDLALIGWAGARLE